jgi:hypothetical protein
MARAKAKTKTGAQPAGQTESFTGVAFTTQACKDTGFANYRICTLFIVNGEIVHIEKSQEFAMFESIARTEIMMNRAHWNLSNRYRDKAYQSLGGEERDKLINRLKDENPELLNRIAPALGIEA